MRPGIEPGFVNLPHGEEWPALGLGTWQMGEDDRQRPAEVAAVRAALEIGYRVIDTAEMYGQGAAERVVGEAVAAALRQGTLARDDLRIVSKVLPGHATPAGMRQACEASLRRLRLDCLDLYLLHWRGTASLADAIEGMERLQARGLIRHWGVSNFDLADMRELRALHGGGACSANQVYYSLGERGPEFELLRWQRTHSLPLMAYSPLDGGSLLAHPGLRAMAGEIGCATAQLALAWLLHQPQVLAIPKSAHPLRLRHNWEAAALRLSADDLARLDRLFPPPRQRHPLAMR